MKKSLVHFTIASLLALACLSLPATVQAAGTNLPAVKQTEPAKVKQPHEILPFHGKVAAVDAKAMTITIGKRVFNITSETKITKDGKPATLSQAVVGENVGGAYKKESGDKLQATTIHFGTKEEKPATTVKPTTAVKPAM